jgi:hypothetical protein
MPLILKDRVQETSTTTGTGTLTLAGAVTQFQTFSAAVGNGNTTYYTIYNAGGSQWEVGLGTVGAGTLARTTVLASSNAGAAVNFTGTLYVFGDYPADKAAFLDASGVINNTTFNATTSVITPIVQATNSGGLALKNSVGTTQISMGGGGGDNVSISVATNINGANAQIDISPTGTGHVHIKPTGTGSLEIAPTNVGTINNMTIGATTAVAGSFTNLSVTGTTSFDGAQGSAGQVLTSAGTGNTPTWATPTTGTVTSVAASGGTGISVSGSPITGSGTITITNTAPDQTVVLTAGTGISTSGTYPSFTIANTGVTVYPGAGIANSTGSAWGTSYTTSGSGTVVALATAPALNTPVVTNYTETLFAPAAGSAFTVSLSDGTVQKFSLNANGTITLPNSVAGKSFVIIVTYSGAFTLTWAGGSTIKWPGGTAPTASSANGKFDIFTFFQDGTNTYGNSFGLNY